MYSVIAKLMNGSVDSPEADDFARFVIHGDVIDAFDERWIEWERLMQERNDSALCIHLREKEKK